MTSHHVTVFFLSSLMFPLLPFVSGHGRLVEPPSRSSMWRFGFSTKPNYNDNELFCGGYTVHWQRNGGKCGICGDAWDAPRPRPNEAGGIYGKGVIVRKYRPGEMIKAGVQITANHKGFFEFKLCPHNDPSTDPTQECLDRNPLELADGSGSKYYPHAGTGVFNVKLRLPQHLTCSQCVFQWTYTAGNNWGRCNNGSSGLGCGPQETFRGCADVAISGAETNDVPSFDDRPDLENPSITSIPSRRPGSRPRPSPRPTPPRPTPPNRRRPIITRRPITRRPVSYNYPSRGSSTTPKTRPSIPTRRPNSRPRPTQGPSVPDRRRTIGTRRPVSYPTRGLSTTPKTTPYPRPTRYNRKPSSTKKPTPTLKPKPDRNKPMIETESESNSSCHAVGVWKTVPGMANWCDNNCARGYCPGTHCSCN